LCNERENENVPYFLKAIIHPVRPFYPISKSLLVNAGSSLLNDMFEVMQASWVIAVEYVFKKFS